MIEKLFLPYRRPKSNRCRKYLAIERWIKAKTPENADDVLRLRCRKPALKQRTILRCLGRIPQMRGHEYGVAMGNGCVYIYRRNLRHFKRLNQSVARGCDAALTP